MRDSVHFLVSFHLGAWYFFHTADQLSPLVLDRPFGASPDPGPTHGVDPPLSRTEKTLRQKGGAYGTAGFLVQMWRIRTWWRSWWSQHHWDHFLRRKMVFFFFGKTDYFVKNRCWQWELEPFGWELGCFHGFNNSSQQDHSSLSKCWRKGSKNQIFIRSSINLHIIIYMQKNLAPWFFGEVGYFVGQIFPVFFFWAWKKTPPPRDPRFGRPTNAAAGSPTGHPLHWSRALG